MPFDHPPTNFVPDRWIALSSLQKSIRRGAIEPAMAAAEILWSEPSRFLDRLLVIGVEDIGVGDLKVLRDVVELTTDRGWRRKLSDKGRAVTLGLVERMCAPQSPASQTNFWPLRSVSPPLVQHATSWPWLREGSSLTSLPPATTLAFVPGVLVPGWHRPLPDGWCTPTPRRSCRRVEGGQIAGRPGRLAPSA